jgi:hypothetical protein
LIAGYADRALEDIVIRNLRVKMLPEERPDKRATHAIIIERVNGLTLSNIDVDWDERSPEPAWGSALVLRDVSRLVLDGFRGRAGNPATGTPAIVKQRVKEQGAN